MIPIIRTKLPAHWFKYSAKILGSILFAFTIMSFTPSNSKVTNIAITYGDSTDTTKGFVTLFNTYDPYYSGSGSFEINPKAKSFVQEYVKQNQKMFQNMKVWGKPYFILYEKILAQYSLPAQLKYLSVIESHLRATSVSYAGAVGPWQLMPSEAQRWGLKTDVLYDERTDYVKSTHAAAKLLKTLYRQYGDWLLVIAAYNSGPGWVDKAIKKTGSKDFWNIQYHLPTETRDHVKKFIATHYYFEGSGGWTTMTAKEAKLKKAELSGDAPVLTNTATIEISGRYNSVVIANALMIDIVVFNQLNPLLDHLLAQGQNYQLRLPSEKVELFQAKKQDILKESVQLLLFSSSAANFELENGL